MFGLIITKELKNIIQSPKFAATFLTLSILIILSFIIGINEYKNSVNQYNTANSLAQEEMKEARSWQGVQQNIYREPSPMVILTGGVNYDVGRFSNISHNSEVKLQNSVYSDDPIFALFRNLDFTTIVTIVFSLFAILFSYNAINGEKEGGTLKLVFSNPVSRVKYIISKFAGSWLGLAIPLLVPIMIGILLLLLYNINLSSLDWINIISIIFVSIIYLTFFLALGIFISSLTKSSTYSFMILLVIWIAIVFIVPRIAVMTAGQIVDVPSLAQIESQQDAFSKDRWKLYMDELNEIWQQRNEKMLGMNDTDKEAYEDEMSYDWMIEDDSRRKLVESDIAEYNRKINEEFSNNKNILESLALSLSRISPASSFQLAVMQLANTDVEIKKRYEESMREYKKKFMTFINKKQEESGESGMLKISISSDGGFKTSNGREESGLDVSEVPKYFQPDFSYLAVAGSVIVDTSLLILYIAFCFGAAFTAFLRYDLR